MPQAARITDKIQGMTSGEHCGHYTKYGPVHSPSLLTGNINSNCSSKVYINGLQGAYIGSITIEYDDCCGSSSGSVATGSSKVFIQGNLATRVGDSINTHNGYANIITGSSNVFIK